MEINRLGLKSLVWPFPLVSVSSDAVAAQCFFPLSCQECFLPVFTTQTIGFSVFHSYWKEMRLW